MAKRPEAEPTATGCSWLAASILAVLLNASLMVKHVRKIVLAAVCLCGAGFIISAKAPAEGKQYDYVSIVQRADELQISSSQAQYQEIKITEERIKLTVSNYTPLFRKINEFEAQGYELVENTVYTLGEGAIPRNYILMRRLR